MQRRCKCLVSRRSNCLVQCSAVSPRIALCSSRSALLHSQAHAAITATHSGMARSALDYAFSSWCFADTTYGRRAARDSAERARGTRGAAAGPRQTVVKAVRLGRDQQRCTMKTWARCSLPRTRRSGARSPRHRDTRPSGSPLGHQRRKKISRFLSE